MALLGVILVGQIASSPAGEDRLAIVCRAGLPVGSLRESSDQGNQIRMPRQIVDENMTSSTDRSTRMTFNELADKLELLDEDAFVSLAVRAIFDIAFQDINPGSGSDHMSVAKVIEGEFLSLPYVGS